MAEYRNALRAQVLQTVPASRSGEDETKTGAADFIVYRCVEDCLDRYEGYEVVLLASGDRGLREACMTSFEERGLLVAGHHSEVLRQIIAFERATDELVEVVEDFLRHKDLDDLGLFEDGLMGLEPDVDRVRLAHEEEVTVEYLETASDSAERIASGRIRVVGRLGLLGYEVESTPDDDFYVVEHEYGQLDAVVLAPISVRFDADWNPTEAAVSGPAEVESTGFFR